MKHKKWELDVVDNLDYEIADRIGRFIGAFYDPAESRERRCNSAEYYLWKLIKNPYGKGFVSLAVDGNKIVGTTTLTRKRVWFRGNWVNAGEIGDTFTHPDYQRQGIFSSLVISTRDRAIAEGVDLIYGTPNAASLAGYEKHCGFLRKKGLHLFLWVLPLGMLPLISKYLDRPLQRLYPRTLDSAIGLLFRKVSAFASGDCEHTSLSFDTDFDVLEAHLRDTCAFMIARGAEALTFRLAENPDKDRYGVLVRRRQGGRLSGVLLYKDTAQEGLRILFVCDTYAEDYLSLATLWNAALSFASERKYDMIALWAPRRLSSILAMLPIPPVPFGRKELILYDFGLGRDALNHVGHWHFSVLDSDNV